MIPSRAAVLLTFVFATLALSSGPARGGASMALHIGMEAGGELFRVKSADDITGTTYYTPDGRSILATEIRTELEESISFGVRVRVPVRRKLSVSLGLTAADLDVTGKRRTVTESVDDIAYDQMFAMHSDLSVEYDWLEKGNRPFLSMGLGFVSMDFEEGDSRPESLDQTPLAIVVGGGFRLRSLAAMDFDLEARGYRVSTNWDDEEDRLVPAASFEGKDAIWLWQISLAAVYEF